MKQRRLRLSAMLMFLLGTATIVQGQSFQLKITDIQKNKGKVVVSIYDHEQGWFEKPFKEIIFQTNENSKVVTFDVPFGVYAVSVYQDTKSNDELDRNFMGIPKEPIAFGNNYKPFGNPDYESASIEFNPEYKMQTLKLYTVF